TVAPEAPVLPSVVRHRISSPTPPANEDDDFIISSFSTSDRPGSREHFVLGDRVDEADETGGDDDQQDDDTLREGVATAIYVEPRTDIGPRARPPAFLRERDSVWQRCMRVLWGVLSLVSTLCALLFLIYIFRVQIANSVPALRPMLEQA